MLRDYAQFIVYRLEPHPTKPNKTNKIPCDYNGNIDPLDEKNWLTYEQAKDLVARGVGTGIGFTYSEYDPFCFIDVDTISEDPETWNTVYSMMEGAAMEWSTSGDGAHVICVFDASRIGHVGRRTTFIEVYTTRRFVALTENWFEPGLWQDQTDQLAALITHFNLWPKVDSANAVTWQDQSIIGYEGPADDGELIAAMKRNRKQNAGFGDSLTFTQLWNGDIAEHQAKAVGMDSSESAYVHMLLCKLAFWTGYNHARMARLYEQSGFAAKSDKWGSASRKWERLQKDEIERAVDFTYNQRVNAGGPLCGYYKPPETETAKTAAIESGFTKVDGSRFYGANEQTELFQGCVYITSLDRILTPKGQTLTQSQFNSHMPGATYMLGYQDSKTTNKAWDAYILSQHTDFRRVDDYVYRPGSPPIFTEGGIEYANLYRDHRGPQFEGDAKPFLDHVRLLFNNPMKQAIVLSYMAGMVQNVGQKFKWTLVVQGISGCGKSLLGRCVSYAVGRENCHEMSGDHSLKSNFNAWMGRCCACIIHELYMDKRLTFAKRIGSLVTEPMQEIEAKGVDTKMMQTCVNFLMFTEHEDAVRKTIDDRRWCVLFSSLTNLDQVKELDSTGYYKRFINWLENEDGFAIVAHYLQHYPVSVDLHGRVPDGGDNYQAIEASRNEEEQIIVDHYEASGSCFKEGLTTVRRIRALLATHDIKLTPNRIGATLRLIGMRAHPCGDEKGQAFINGRRESVYVFPHDAAYRFAVDRVRQILEENPTPLKPV